MQSRRRFARIGGGPSTTKEDRMGYATILGLDLGKFKSVCCAMDASSGTKGTPHTPSACGPADLG
jgi:hypothetical protein